MVHGIHPTNLTYEAFSLSVNPSSVREAVLTVHRSLPVPETALVACLAAANLTTASMEMTYFLVDRAAEIHTQIKTVLRRMIEAISFVAPWLFVRELLNRPRVVGAVWPSSGQLARRMAALVPLASEGLVVELGGGTGAVTKALLEQGLSARRLVVVERSPAFVRHLRQRFPSVTVLQGDARQLASLLPPGEPVDVIVSSLPLRSLPQADASAIVAQWPQILRPGGSLIQFTYDLRGLPNHALHGLIHRVSHLVWANLPPARVFLFEI